MMYANKKLFQNEKYYSVELALGLTWFITRTRMRSIVGRR